MNRYKSISRLSIILANPLPTIFTNGTKAQSIRWSHSELTNFQGGTLPPSHQSENEGFVRGKYSVSDFPPSRIRNFSIIAHIDHGKSTLADRLMEFTGAIGPGARQYLDKLQVERDRGITVKAQTASLVYKHPKSGVPYLLNLVDTPGHVDFSYEVSRSLAACQGALLLVDAAQGIQAQTVANFFMAFDQNLSIVPVLNKIDLPAADPDRVAAQLKDAFDLDAADCVHVSAKTGVGLDQLLQAVVDRIPPPPATSCAPGKPSPLRMLLFDAFHDEFRGVICLVNIVDGALKKGDRIASCSNTHEVWDVLDVGIMAPEPVPTGELQTGQVGYVITGMKDARTAKVGDTWHHHGKKVQALPGFKEAKSAVFAGIYPINSDEFEQLHAAMQRLTLNDASVMVQREHSTALGAGFRCGFLGLLHMDVFRQRLEQEHGASVIVTAPTVPVSIELASGSTIQITSPSEYPQSVRISKVWEPTVHATIVAPTEIVGGIMNLAQERRGDLVDHSVLSGSNRAVLRYILPLQELGGDFYDELKSISSGYASFDYEDGEPRPADLVRLDVLVNGEVVDALARIVHRSKATSAGRGLCSKLKSLMDRQQFDIALQAAAGGRIVARETIKAYRKNVLAKCYGGDVSRKRKLLEKQKEGKKRMRRLGNVDLPAEALHEVMRQ